MSYIRNEKSKEHTANLEATFCSRKANRILPSTPTQSYNILWHLKKQLHTTPYFQSCLPSGWFLFRFKGKQNLRQANDTAQVAETLRTTRVPACLKCVTLSSIVFTFIYYWFKKLLVYRIDWHLGMLKLENETVWLFLDHASLLNRNGKWLFEEAAVQNKIEFS